MKEFKMNGTVQEMRKTIAEVGKRMFTRHLTDSAGGNIGVRVEDVILMTPRYAGSLYHWKLAEEQILLFDLQGNKLAGNGDISRESQVHFALLNTLYPMGTAVLHGHALNALVFCAAGKPIPPVLDSATRVGQVELARPAAAHSADLANSVLAALQPQSERIQKYAAAVLAPRHGVFVMAKDLLAGYDALERVDVNAYCVLMSKLIS
jgi:L-fuculose-phosphate aldolase